MLRRMILPSHSLDNLRFPALPLIRVKLYDDIIHIVRPDAPMSADRALEISIYEQILQNLQPLKSPVKLADIRANQRIGSMQHKN